MSGAESVKRRWGILAISVVMFLVVLFASSRGSPYSVFWILIGYLSYKGRTDELFQWIKVVAIINAVLIALIAVFFQSNSGIFALINVGGKADLLVGTGVMLVVKIGILLYLISQKKEVSGGAVGVVFPAGEAIRPEAALPGGLSEMGGTRVSLLARSGSPSRSSISDTVTATNVEEEFWARALDECDGPSRRRGLWARVFSEAQGNEAIAKANYLKHRAAELRVDDQENRLRINEQEQRSAYDLLPKGRCPKCAAVIPLVSKECPECKESFTAYEGVAAIPIAGSDAEEVVPSEAKGEIPRNLVASSTATLNWSTVDFAFFAFVLIVMAGLAIVAFLSFYVR